jgi:outer membrane protein OmpA-like peptidoglycan-associated protein/uncharacterized cupredoxin-like copper-binding protein
MRGLSLLHKVLTFSLIFGALQFGISPALASTPQVNLCTAGNYVLLGNVVTNGAATRISSTYPGALVGDSNAVELAALTGSESGTITNEPNSAAHSAAMADLGMAISAFTSLIPSATVLQTTELSTDYSGSLPLGHFGPGAYTTPAALNVAAGTTITLDANNDSNAKFYFIVGAAFTVGASVTIALINGAQAENVYWVAGTFAGDMSLGATSTLVGNFLVNGTATLGGEAHINGRVLATGTVTLGASALIQGAAPNAGCPAGVYIPVLTSSFVDITLVPATVGVAYSDYVSAKTVIDGVSNIVGSGITYAILSGTLPSGLSFNTGTGYITGTLPAGTPASTITFTFTATSSGYPTATSVPINLVINAAAVVILTPQTISFPTLNAMTVGNADQQLNATATSGLAVIYTATPSGVCTIVLGKVHAVTAGTCTVTAAQPGNSIYSGATNVVQNIVINTALVLVRIIIFTDTTLADGIVGKSYSDYIQAKAFIGSTLSSTRVSYSISGTLPSGLSFRSSTGYVWGTISKSALPMLYTVYISAYATGFATQVLRVDFNVKPPVAPTRHLTPEPTPTPSVTPTVTTTPIIPSTTGNTPGTPEVGATPPAESQMLLLSTVWFASGRSVLTPSAIMTLNSFLTTIKKNGFKTVVINGYTDAVPGQDHLTLSTARANAVALYLFTHNAKVSITSNGLGLASASLTSTKSMQVSRKAEIWVSY